MSDERYDDNISLSQDQAKADSITRVLPTFAVRYPMRTAELSVNYAPQGVFYAQNNERNILIHTANVDGRFRFLREAFVVSISDVYTLRPRDNRRLLVFGYDPVDPSTPLLAAPTEGTPPSIYKDLTYVNIFSVSPQATYKLSPHTDLEIGYRYASTNYHDPQGVDALENSAFLNLRKRVTRSLTSGLTYRFSKTVYTVSVLNVRENILTLFADYQWSRKTSLQVDYGYSILSYKNVHIWHGNLTYQFTKEISVTFNTSSFIYAYTDGSIWNSKAVGGNIRYDRPKFITLSGQGSYRIDIGNIDSTFKNFRYEMKGSLYWFINDDLDFSAIQSFSKVQFRPGSEEEDLWSQEARFIYRVGIRWSTGAAYQRIVKRSDRAADFVSNVYSIFLSRELF